MRASRSHGSGVDSRSNAPDHRSVMLIGIGSASGLSPRSRLRRYRPAPGMTGMLVSPSSSQVTPAWSWLRASRHVCDDPLNLLAVDASANRQKGDGDAATWLPPNKSFRCDYAARQIAVKLKFRAWSRALSTTP
jgi:hypothetical protein